MSFKHNKFEDSEIMRSLEKVAVQKGLVKSEPAKEMRKEASNNLSATGNLTQDIVKLCSGLRASGFIAQANEIEKNFIMFKQAETLYQTSKETGKDLVDAAHPDGSHQLKDLKHKVLTITDRHEVLLDKVNKKPTGKLATSSDIIKAVKMALGQQNYLQTYNEAYNSIVNNFKELNSSYTDILNKAKEMDVDVLDDDEYKPSVIFQRINRILGSKIRLPKFNQILNAIPSDAVIQELKGNLQNTYDRIKPHGARGVSKIDWADLEPLFTNNIFTLIGEIETSANAARAALQQLQDIDPKIQRAEDVRKINSKLSIVSNAITWLTSQKEAYLSLNGKDISVRNLIQKLSTDKEYLEISLNSIKKAELSIDDAQLLANLAIIDKRIQKVRTLQEAYKGAAVESDSDEGDSDGGAGKGEGEGKGEGKVEGTPPPAPQITGAQLKDKMTAVYTTTQELLAKFNKISTTTQNKSQIDQIKKTLVDYRTPMDKYMPGVTKIANIENPEAWKTATKIGQSLDNNVYFSSIDKIISARQEALKQINTTYLQLTEQAAADDGIFSAATLNAIKALKISLGEGEYTVTDQDRIEFAMKAKQSALSALRTAVAKCYEASENNAKSILSEGEIKISAMTPNPSADFYAYIEGLLNSIVAPARSSVEPWVGSPNDLQKDAINAINMLDSHLRNVRNFLLQKNDDQIIASKKEQKQEKEKSEKQKATKDKAYRYNTSIDLLRSLMVQLIALNQDPQVLNIGKTSPVAKNYIKQEHAEIKQFVEPYLLSEEDIEGKTQTELDAIADQLNPFYQQEKKNIDAFVNALRSGVYDQE